MSEIIIIVVIQQWIPATCARIIRAEIVFGLLVPREVKNGNGILMKMEHLTRVINAPMILLRSNRERVDAVMLILTRMKKGSKLE